MAVYSHCGKALVRKRFASKVLHNSDLRICRFCLSYFFGSVLFANNKALQLYRIYSTDRQTVTSLTVFMLRFLWYPTQPDQTLFMYVSRV